MQSSDEEHGFQERLTIRQQKPQPTPIFIGWVNGGDGNGACPNFRVAIIN
jgi:hypothetical protein